MHLIKPHYSPFIFLYLPFLVTAVLVFHAWPQQIAWMLKFIFPLFLFILVLFLVLPVGSRCLHSLNISQKKPLSSLKNTKFPVLLGLWFLLELGLVLIYIAIKQAVMGNTTPITEDFSQMLFMGFYPWTFYILLGIAYTYFIPEEKEDSFIKNSLRPMYKNSLDGKLGLGVDFAMKQGIIFLCCMTIGILIIQFSNLLSLSLGIPANAFQTPSLYFTTFVIFLLLASPFWRRFTRYLEIKRYSLGKILALIAGSIIGFIIMLNVCIKHFSPSLLYHPLNTTPSPQMWHFFSLIWWTAWGPIIAIFVAQLARNHTIRATILTGLLFPICLIAFSYLAEHSELSSQWLLLETSFLGNKLSQLIISILALMSVIFLFRSTNGLGIQTASQIERQTVSGPSIRLFGKLITLAMLAYILTGLSPLTLLGAAVIWFVFYNSTSACIILTQRMIFTRSSG